MVKLGLKRGEHVLFVHTLVRRYQPQNTVERTNPNRIVVGDGDALM